MDLPSTVAAQIATYLRQPRRRLGLTPIYNWHSADWYLPPTDATVYADWHVPTTGAMQIGIYLQLARHILGLTYDWRDAEWYLPWAGVDMN